MAKLFTNEYHVVATYISNQRLGKNGWEDCPEGVELTAETYNGIDKRVDAILLAREIVQRGFKVYVYEMNPTPILEEDGVEPEPDNWHEDDHHGESLSDHYYEDIESRTDYCNRMGFDM